MTPDDSLARWLEGDDPLDRARPGDPASRRAAGLADRHSSEPFPASPEDEYGIAPRPPPAAERVATAARVAAASAGAGAAAGAAAAAAVPTGFAALDAALGIGGWPRGHLSEIYGSEGSGKSTLALRAIANAQADGGAAALIDAEHGLDPAYARRLGVDLGALLIHQPDHGEQAFEIGEMLMASNAIDLLVVDSAAALTPREEVDGHLEGMPSGLQAALMTRCLRRWSFVARKTRAAILFLNQLRHQPRPGWQEPVTTAGGRALRFYAAVRTELAILGALPPAAGAGEWEGGGPSAAAPPPAGVLIRAKITKNRLSAPGREAKLELRFH